MDFYTIFISCWLKKMNYKTKCVHYSNRTLASHNIKNMMGKLKEKLPTAAI